MLTTLPVAPPTPPQLGVCNPRREHPGPGVAFPCGTRAGGQESPRGTVLQFLESFVPSSGPAQKQGPGHVGGRMRHFGDKGGRGNRKKRKRMHDRRNKGHHRDPSLCGVVSRGLAPPLAPAARGQCRARSACGALCPRAALLRRESQAQSAAPRRRKGAAWTRGLSKCQHTTVRRAAGQARRPRLEGRGGGVASGERAPEPVPRDPAGQGALRVAGATEPVYAGALRLRPAPAAGAPSPLSPGRSRRRFMNGAHVTKHHVTSVERRRRRRIPSLVQPGLPSALGSARAGGEPPSRARTPRAAQSRAASERPPPPVPPSARLGPQCVG